MSTTTVKKSLNQKLSQVFQVGVKLMLAGAAGVLVSTPSHAQEQAEAPQSNTPYSTPFQDDSVFAVDSNQDDAQLYDARFQEFERGRRGGRGGWVFVGCGRRSKCVDMANAAGFPYGYAGIDANVCPHDNACYGRY